MMIQATNSTRNYTHDRSTMECMRERARAEIFTAVCLVVNRTIGSVCPLQRIAWERDSRVCICGSDFGPRGGVGGCDDCIVLENTDPAVSFIYDWNCFPPLFDFPPHKANRLSQKLRNERTHMRERTHTHTHSSLYCGMSAPASASLAAWK